jgi:hypothetical protein
MNRTAAKALLWLHIACVVLAYLGIGVLFFLWPSVGYQDSVREVIHSVVFWLAAIGFVSGLGSMACRSGKSESVVLAASTIAALLPMFFVMAVFVV